MGLQKSRTPKIRLSEGLVGRGDGRRLGRKISIIYHAGGELTPLTELIGKRGKGGGERMKVNSIVIRIFKTVLGVDKKLGKR